MAKVPEIIPVTGLRQDAAAVLKRVQASHQPLVITCRRRAAAVMLSVDAYERKVIVWINGKIVMLWSVIRRSSVGRGCFGEHACLWLHCLKISGMAPQSISFSSGFRAYNALKSKLS